MLKGQRYVPKGFHLRLPVADNVAYTAGLESLYQTQPPTGQTYTVRRGDTAGKIARDHQVRLADLIAANGLDSRARVYPNQKLKIPGDRETAGRLPGPTQKADESPDRVCRRIG